MRENVKNWTLIGAFGLYMTSVAGIATNISISIRGEEKYLAMIDNPDISEERKNELYHESNFNRSGRLIPYIYIFNNPYDFLEEE